MYKSIFNFITVSRNVISGALLLIVALSGIRASAQCSTIPGNQASFGEGHWIGYVYTDYTPGSPPADAFSGTYRGYIETAGDTINRQWGTNPIVGDSLCGSYTDYYAVKFKMRKTLDPGYYYFRVGGDDGWRLSLDGGATYVLNNQWNSHGYIPADLVYHHLGGTLDMVVDYYEDGGGAVIDFNYHFMDCTSTAPTGISGNTSVYSCSPTTTLTATGGINGVGGHYEWGTGTVVGENIIPGIEAPSITVSPAVTTSYWVRRYAAYECAGPTQGVVTTVEYTSGIPGDPSAFGDNTWIAYCYSGSNAAADTSGITYKGFYTENTTGFDSDASWNRESNPGTAATWQGCAFTSNDYFTFVYKRQGFTCGDYTLHVNDWDDRIRIYIDGVLQFTYDGWSGGAPAGIGDLGVFHLTETSKIEVRVAEDGGGANGQLDITPVIVGPASISGNALACNNEQVTLTALGATAASVYQWGTGNVAGENIIGGQTASAITFNASSDNTYWARVFKPSCSGYTDAVFFTIGIQDNQWTGAVSSDWNTAGNWSCGSIPTTPVDVTIPNATNDPVISGGSFHIKSLTVQNGAVVTVSTGATLQVVNEVAIATGSSLIVQNNAALVQDNDVVNTGTAQVHKNSNALYRLDYGMWSSPVSGQTLGGFSPLTSTDRFYTYVSTPANAGTASGHFQVVSSVATTAFAQGTGYLIRTPNTGSSGYVAGTEAAVLDGTFTGTPNNGDITVGLNTTGDKFTAVGNPYPSPIGVAEVFAAGNGIIDGSSPLYFWRKRNNSAHSSYYSVTTTSYTQNDEDGGTAITGFSGNASAWTIAPGQGFLVKAGAGSAFTFTNSMRRPATATQTFFREANDTALSRVWINLTDANTNFSQASIVYLDGATLGLDYGMDGEAFSTSGTSIYTTALNKALAIQTRPAFEPSDKVTVGFTVPAPGQYTISLDHFDGLFANGQEVFIKDNVLGLTHSLTQSAYSFTANAGTLTTRFEIVYTTDGALGTQVPVVDANAVIVYKQDKAIHINTGTAVINSVVVYDVQGRKLYSQDKVSTASMVISNLAVSQEMLILQIITNKGTVSKKIVY